MFYLPFDININRKHLDIYSGFAGFKIDGLTIEITVNVATNIYIITNGVGLVCCDMLNKDSKYIRYINYDLVDLKNELSEKNISESKYLNAISLRI